MPEISNPCLISGKAFGLPISTQFLGWEAFSDPSEDPRRMFMPKINRDYEFRKEVVSHVLSFLTKPYGDTLFLSGPTGSGKTSIVLQVCARLNWHIQEISCSESLESADMFGSYALKQNPQNRSQAFMDFIHGPLIEAMKHGDVLLLNEFDTADPGQLAALNTVMEGGSLLIKETGEVVEPHPMFRLILTGNSTGQGDITGAYQGVLAQNMATMDRCRTLLVEYPKHQKEISLLKGLQVKNLAEETIKAMVNSANIIRKEFIAGKIPVTFSTRTLIRWARLIGEATDVQTALSESLHVALLNRVGDPTAKEAVFKSIKACFPNTVKW